MHSGLVSLVMTLCAFGALAASAATILMAHSLLRPPRMTDGRAAWLVRRLSPGDLGLAFENAPITVRDERVAGARLMLTGWWIPSKTPTDRCVVLLHDYGDAKVGIIAWAPIWHALDFHILALDLRAHGESDGTCSTAGFFERHDIAQAINELRAERPDQTRSVVLFGVGLGAAVAAATAAAGADVAAVVLDSTFIDFAGYARYLWDQAGFPGRWFQNLALELAERIAGASFSAVQPVGLLANITCPVMVIAPAADRLAAPGDLSALEAALAARLRPADDLFWRVPDAGHALAIAAELEEYRRQLERFLSRAMSKPSGAALLGQPCSLKD